MTAQAPSCERCNDAKQVRLVGDWGPLGVSERIIDCPDCQPKPSEGTVSDYVQRVERTIVLANVAPLLDDWARIRFDLRELTQARATIERQAGEIETLHARNQSRELRIAELEADLAAARLNAFDKAVADELPRVSHLEYDSHEICKHFAAKVRERIAAGDGK